MSLEFTMFLNILMLFLIWTLVWKGIALYAAARNNQKAWFIVIFILNTAAILEIVYLMFFQKKVKEVKKVRRKR